MVPDFEVLTFATADAALSEVGRALPDLILLDIMMPMVDGLLFVKKLRRIEGAAEVPIDFVTARPNSPKIQRLDELGALGIIAKPYDPIGLAAQVQEMWQLGVPGVTRPGGAGDEIRTHDPYLGKQLVLGF